MNRGVLEDMLHRVDKHFQDEELKKMLKECIQEKTDENSRWSSMTIYTHYMLGGTSPFIERIAALTEMIILSLDIVDDLQDQDNFSKPWMKCPQSHALNAVLSMLAIFMAEIGEVGHSRIPNEIGKLLARSVEGQHKDVSQSVNTEADYFDMVQSKSGSLIRLACFMGYSLIDGLDRETADRINELADCIGVIAQIGNDVNDLLRYDVKNDLLQKKRTLPIIFLLADSNEEFPPIEQFYVGQMNADEFLQMKTECMQYIQDSGCIEYSKVIQILYTNKAEELFQAIPAVSPWKEKFKEITFG
ncbi:polyprenyl synthetase family protein [Cohnella silvisoli]|uniref:Polyprenyl synthetase family protein n=1 Tax=Cohnella silvisoli TaxID=2873699 RepID=A0ABV1KYK1_9BACL|nr:polyprenyl synthetase family protein [Cohnella silvisoli]MCD9024162.1 polyprenyl synthetase family protein [Cohnella silvisoli]